jgi:hypothetical protein
VRQPDPPPRDEARKDESDEPRDLTVFRPVLRLVDGEETPSVLCSVGAPATNDGEAPCEEQR